MAEQVRACFICGNKTSTLHVLPKKEELRKKWLKCIFGTPPAKYHAKLVLCSDHFDHSDFSNFGAYSSGFASRLSLKPDSVPSRRSTTSSLSAGTSLQCNTRTVDCQTDLEIRSVGTQLSMRTLQPPYRSKGSQTTVSCLDFGVGTSTDPWTEPDSTPIQNIPKYIVYETCLLELFEMCPVCQSVCRVRSRRLGTFLTVDQLCPHCQFTRQWKSQPIVGSTPAGNIQPSAAICFSGASDNKMEKTAPNEESCPGITFDISEFTFVNGEENNCSNEEGVEADEDSNEEEDEEEIADSDSDWEMEDSDQLESDVSDEQDLNLDSELHKSVRQLCPECGVFFFTCKTHTCEYKIKPFSCNICGKRCVDENSLKIHSNIHKDSYEHPCKFCMVPFKTRLDKLAHERAHTLKAKPYECPDCSMSFSKLPARNLHLKGHRGPKIFSCPHCALEFRTAHYMDRHIVVHTGVKQFSCQFCSRSFNQQGHLKSHLRVHTGEKPFKCQHCDKSFNHNVSLKSHVMRYHKEASDSGPSGHMKQIKKKIIRSSGRPKGRPKRNAAMGETNSIPAVQGEGLDPIIATEPSEEGHLRRAFSKDIESNLSDRDPTSECIEEDKAEESNGVRKGKRKASQRSKTFHIADNDFESDSDSNPAEEAKKRQVVKSQET